MNELVYLKNDQAITDSMTVADMFEKRHDLVLRAIDNLLETLRKNVERSNANLFIESKRKAADGQYHRMFYMNRDGFSLLVMGFTGKKALIWKLQYIDAFNKMESIIMERKTDAWIEAREQGKIARKEETDVIQKLVEYAKEQGSNHPDEYYRTYSKLAKKMANVTDRDTATYLQLNDLSTAERIIANVVLKEMSEGVYYKQIYKDCKERLETVKNWLVA